MEINVSRQTKETLEYIAKTKKITVEEAAELVLERQSPKYKNVLERAIRVADLVDPK